MIDSEKFLEEQRKVANEQLKYARDNNLPKSVQNALKTRAFALNYASAFHPDQLSNSPLTQGQAKRMLEDFKEKYPDFPFLKSSEEEK